MGRQENVEIFEDTFALCKQNSTLRNAIEQSTKKQKLYPEGIQCAEKQAIIYARPAKIIVSSKRTLEAAMPYAYAGKKVCIHNFASAANPGGGVVKGSSAQEEAICRCSTLYPNLKEEILWKQFYAPHRRQQNPLHNDDCIYTPGVIAFKSDTAYPKLLPEDKWYSVNVLTCAAPNLLERPSNSMNPNDGNTTVRISQKELQALHEKRMRKVLDIAWKNGNEVVILGAFGCGAFSNPPLAVAQAMKAVVQEYRMKFETIEFAVYCSPRDDSNFRVFQNILGSLWLPSDGTPCNLIKGQKASERAKKNAEDAGVELGKSKTYRVPHQREVWCKKKNEE